MDIKFRIWGEYKQMYYDIASKVLLQGGCLKPINDFVLLQYCGLEDKNGKEIYQGDILKDKFGDIYEVRWKNCDVKSSPGKNDTNLLHSSGWLEMEIIGNIYDYEKSTTGNYVQV